MTDQSLELHTAAVYAPNLSDISDLGIQLYVCTGVFALVGAFTVHIYVKKISLSVRPGEVGSLFTQVLSQQKK